MLRLLALCLFSCCQLAALWGQCPTQEEIRAVIADSSFSPELYVSDVRENCPSAADSLSKVFYARSLYYNGLGDRKQAIAFGEYARIELEQLDTTLQLGKIHYNLGYFNFKEGNLREAAWYFRKASKLFALINHPESQRRRLQSLEDLGLSYSLLGDFQRSEETLRLAGKEAKLAGNALKEAHASVRLGDQYLERGDLGAAAGALEVAIAGFAELNEVAALAGARISRVTLNRKKNDPQAAISELTAVLANKDDLTDYDLARAYSIGVLLHAEQENHQLAEAFFTDNVAIAQQFGDVQLEAQAWDNGGEAALRTSNYPLAIKRFTQALSLLIPGYQFSQETLVPSADQLGENPYKVDLLRYLGDLARAFRAASQPEDALAALRAADHVADQLRDGLGAEQSALFWRGKALPVYEQAIQLCGELDRSEEAFYFFEKSRAILLLESLAEADLMGQLPREAASVLAQGQQRLLAAQRALLADDGSATDSLRQVLIAAREEQLTLRDTLVKQYPGLLPESRLTEVVDLATARANLSAAGFGRQLQYFWGTEEVCLLVLSRAEVKLLTLGRVADLESQVKTLLGYLTGARHIDNDPLGYQQAAHQVYQTFIAPAAPPENEALLILPDGLLGYVPFAALCTSSQGGYLLERNPVSFAQSASVFGRTATLPNADALAFTPFVSAITGQSVAPLPFSASEAENLAEHYGAEALSGLAASRTALLENAEGYAILHLGTHAYATRNDSFAPHILTATEPLYLPDVYGLPLNGTLVTLSACQSNIGPLARGEGVLGFGRAFRSAGAGGVVASLWSLNDRATADITADFYAHLAAGQPKHLALHKAQLNYLRRTDLPEYLKSPYYWAPLTYYGDAGSLPADNSAYWWGVAFGILFFLGLVWFSFRRK